MCYYKAMRIIEKKIGRKDAGLRVFLHHDFSSEDHEDMVFPTKRRAVLVIPGGAYIRVSEREAEPIAIAFFNKGYEVAILNYSVGEDIRESNPIEEASLAISYLKSLESVDSENVCAIGFSAGGHLAAMLAEYGKNFNQGAELNAVILAYPVITMGEHAHALSRDMITMGDESKRDLYSAEKNVTPSFPPCFIWSTRSDASVPVENSLMMYSSLVKNGIYSELHVYPKGRHGLSLATRETGVEEEYVTSWIDECFRFLDSVLC